MDQERESLEPPATALSLGKQLCEALGLQDRSVVALELRLASGGAATVTVTEVVTQRQGLAVVDLLKQRFRLEQVGDFERIPLKPDDSGPGSCCP